MRAFIQFVFLALLFLPINTLLSQVIGGRGNGQQAPSEAKAAALSKGGVSGDVNLFNGTFGTSYDLGTVTTPGGLSYNATMSYSSSFAAGNNLPNTSGIPYGEGWNLDIPMISISTEDYNQYNLQEMSNFNTSAGGHPGTIPFNSEYNEGGLLWYAPTLNIPGVASGRMVYKYTVDNYAVFVLHKFERYIEAKFDGSRWEVILDDGTVYHFNVRQGQQRNANNRRLDKAASNTPALGAQVIPKVEVTRWYVNKITHPNKEGDIYFTYHTFGKFDQFQEFKQYRLAQAIKLNTCGTYVSAPKLMWSVFKDVFIKSIDAREEKLEFDYKSIHYPETDRFDSLYTKEVIAEWSSNELGFNTWKRYKHLKADGPYNGYRTFDIGNNNPYVGNISGIALPPQNERYLYEENVITSNNAAFEHGFLESPLLDYNIAGQELPVGDMYELRVEISNPTNKSCNFDINIVAGDNTNIQQAYHTVASEQYPLVNSWNQRRSETVFTTFNQAVKWNTTANEFNQNSLQTSNFFTMPNLLPEYGGIRIQVGPGNADIDYALDPRHPSVGMVNQNGPENCHAYYENHPFCNPTCDSYNGYLAKGHNVTPNFGIGLPWYMVGDLYHQGSTMIDYHECISPQSSGLDFWWENDPSGVTNDYPNVPTLADENFKIKKVELIRHKRNSYMLHSIRHVKINGYDSQIIDHNNWKTLQKQSFEYEEALLPHFSVYKDTLHVQNDAGTTSVFDFPTTSVDLARNRSIYLLKKIKQMPIKEDATFNVNELPTTHFDYDTTAFIGVTGLPEDYYGYIGNTNHVLLTKITDPLGKQTQITYQNKPITLTNFVYRPRPTSHTPSLVPDNSRKSWNPFSSTVYYQVQNKSILDANGIRQWDYEYFGMKYYNAALALPLNIAWDKSVKPSYGFSKTIVTEPELTSGNKPYSIYYHHNHQTDVDLDYPYFTGENPAILRGKLYRVENYDGQDNLISKRITRHDYHKAFLRGSQRRRHELLVMNDNGNQPLGHDYIDVIEADYHDTSVPNITGLSCYSDMSFCEIGYEDLINSQNPNYLDSYFLKVTKVKETAFDNTSSGGIDSIQTITQYEYFDADTMGVTNSEGYDILLHGNANWQQLQWEPSWQLYKTRSYSPQYPDAFSQKEYFYYYDLINRDDMPVDMGYGLAVNLSGLDDGNDGWFYPVHWSWKYRMRNIAFEERVTTKAPAQDSVMTSNYFMYSNDWNDVKVNTVDLPDIITLSICDTIPPPQDTTSTSPNYLKTTDKN